MTPDPNTKPVTSYCTRWLLIFSVFFATCFTAVSFCYELARTDVLYADSIWVELLYLTRQICHTLFFSVLFGFLLYGIYRFGIKQSLGLLLSALEGLLFLMLVSFFSYLIVNAAWSPSGMLPLVSAMLTELVSQMIIVAIFVLLFCWILRSAKKQRNATAFPYSSFFSFRNPIQLGALAGALILFLPVLIENISFDIYYGAPDSLAEWSGLLLYYLIDTLICLVLPYIAITAIAKKAENQYQKQ